MWTESTWVLASEHAWELARDPDHNQKDLDDLLHESLPDLEAELEEDKLAWVWVNDDAVNAIGVDFA